MDLSASNSPLDATLPFSVFVPHGTLIDASSFERFEHLSHGETAGSQLRREIVAPSELTLCRKTVDEHLCCGPGQSNCHDFQHRGPINMMGMVDLSS
jgi:hypothetical protein